MASKGVHSVPRVLKKNYDALAKQEGVSRVIVGPSERASYKSGTGFFKYVSDFLGGIKIKGFTEKGITYFYVYCSNPEDVKIFLSENS
jgi:hypothetical protein